MQQLLKSIPVIFLCLFLSATVCHARNGTADNKEGEAISNEAWQRARALGLGWNLGNQLDASRNGVSEETAWGNPTVTPEFIRHIAEVGFTTIRIPVTWMGHIGDAPDFTLEESWLDRVYEIVGYAEQAGLNVIINVHHDGADKHNWLNLTRALADENDRAAITAKFTALWRQIALKFQDKGDFLMFESMNEIHDGSWQIGEDAGRKYDLVNEWNQAFVNTVRAIGGNNATRYLGVPGYVTNIDYTIEGFRLPQDPTATDRLMVSVHYYDPYQYALEGTYSEWGHTGKNTAGENEEAYLSGQFQKLKTTFVDHNIPVYIGEMGPIYHGNGKDSFRLYYLEYLCKAAVDCGIAPIYWDNGGTRGKEAMALFDRRTLEFVNHGGEAVECMKRAVFTKDASYTLESVYNAAPMMNE